MGKREREKKKKRLTLRASIQEHAAVLEEIPWDVGHLFELLGHGDDDEAVTVDVERPLEDVGGLGAVFVVCWSRDERVCRRCRALEVSFGT